MPYSSNADLPLSVRNALPLAAQTIWRTIFNAAEKQYPKDDAKAFATAWAGLKGAGWAKDTDGTWHKTARIVKVNESQRYTLGVVYEPNTLDAQGEWASAEEIEQAAWRFLKRLQRGHALLEAVKKVANASDQTIRIEVTDEFAAPVAKGGVGDMHINFDESLGTVVESVIARTDMVFGPQTVVTGSWLVGVQWSSSHFQKILAGDRTGYSMGGMGIRLEDMGVGES